MEKKRVIALVACIFASLMLAAGFVTQLTKRVAEMAGYYVSSAEDLAWYRDAINGGSTHLGVTIKQTADIDLSGYTDWTPIGAGDNYFYGTYDGCGHTIYGLTCEQSEDDEDNALFGTLAGKVVNLNIEDFNVSGRHASAIAVSAADDENSDAKIINCSVRNGYLNGERCGAFADDFTAGEVSGCVSYNVESNITLYGVSYNAEQLYGCFTTFDLFNSALFTGNYNALVSGGKVGSDYMSGEEIVDALGEIQAIICLNGSAHYSDLYEWKTADGKLTFGDRQLSVLNIIMSGSGSERDPYLISSYKDLMVFCNGVNLGRSFAGYFLRQTRDFDLALINNWIPIGIGGTGLYFCGTYDGGGYSFTNIHCESTATHKNNGFFGMLGGTVKNLSLVGGEIYGDCVGGIASHAATINAAIYNCYCSAEMYGRFRSGGIADNFIGNIENCVYIGKNKSVYLVSYYAETLKNSYSNGRLVRSNFAGVIEGCYLLGEDVALAKTVEALNANIPDMESGVKYCSNLFKWKISDGEIGLDVSSITYLPVSYLRTILMILGIIAIIGMALVLYYIFVYKRGLAFNGRDRRTLPAGGSTAESEAGVRVYEGAEAEVAASASDSADGDTAHK